MVRPDVYDLLNFNNHNFLMLDNYYHLDEKI